MEANRVAFVSTVHVADDANGDGFGQGHYVIPRAKRLASTGECSYGPSVLCTIDTRRAFDVAIDFSKSDEPFGFNVTLMQGEQSASYGPVRYSTKPSKGSVPSAADANADLRQRLDEGMTLVASHWAGGARKDMAWLDAPCKADEIADWGCSDAFVDHSGWSWLCSNSDLEPPQCADSFRLNALTIAPSPPPPPAPPAPLLSGRTLGMATGLILVIVGGVCAAIAINKLGNSLFEFQSVSTSIAPEKAEYDISDDEPDERPGDMPAVIPGDEGGSTPACGMPAGTPLRTSATMAPAACRPSAPPPPAPAKPDGPIDVRVTVPPLDVQLNTILILETSTGARVHVPLSNGAAPGDILSFALPAEATSSLSAQDVADLSSGRLVVTAGVEDPNDAVEL